MKEFGINKEDEKDFYDRYKTYPSLAKEGMFTVHDNGVSEDDYDVLYDILKKSKFYGSDLSKLLSEADDEWADRIASGYGWTVEDGKTAKNAIWDRAINGVNLYGNNVAQVFPNTALVKEFLAEHADDPDLYHVNKGWGTENEYWHPQATRLFFRKRNDPEVDDAQVSVALDDIANNISSVDYNTPNKLPVGKLDAIIGALKDRRF